LNYGLELKDIAEVLHSSSGWSTASRNIFRELLHGEHPSATSINDALHHLQIGCMRGSRIGAPLMIANETRSILEQMQSQFSAAERVDEISRIYPAAVQFAAASPLRSAN
jgi:3-hydroxyisobutyrate dehydrogenase